jgi:hypothetical protein
MTASPDIIWDGVTLMVEGRGCGCGDTVLRVCVVQSRTELHCASCNRRAGLLSDRSAAFVLMIAKTFGAPDRPIILRLRRPQATVSAQAEERASRFHDAT